jgi:hypothetical protein
MKLLFHRGKLEALVYTIPKIEIYSFLGHLGHLEIQKQNII